MNELKRMRQLAGLDESSKTRYNISRVKKGDWAKVTKQMELLGITPDVYSTNYMFIDYSDDSAELQKVFKQFGISESFKVNAPTLNKLVKMEYSDPRQKDGCKIVAEKTGTYKDGDRIVAGSYIVYQDSALPGKYLAVHVSDAVNEESGLADVNVVAIGKDKKKVMQNTGYRMRKNKAVEESTLTEGKFTANNIYNMMIQGMNSLDWKKEMNFIGTLQGYGISPEPGYEYTVDDAVEMMNNDPKIKSMFIKDMKKFGFKL